MKRYVPILVAAAIVLALSPAFAGTMAVGELNNGITYFEPMTDCAHAAGIAMGGAAGAIVEVRTDNGITLFEPVQHIYGMGECVNVMAEENATPVKPAYNGITYFELR